MKNVFTCLVLLISLIGFSQTQNEEPNDLKIGKIEFHNLDIVVTVDSLKELESELNKDDFKKMFDEIKEFNTISFKLICNAVGSEKADKKSLSIKIESTTENKEVFLNRIQKIKDLAIKYYQDKN